MRAPLTPLIFIVTLSLSVSSNVAAEGADFVFAKVAATAEQTEQDTAICTEESRSFGQSPAYAPGGVPSPAVALLAGVAQGVRQGRAQTEHLDLCMRRRGYGKVVLSAAERAERDQAGNDEQKRAWFAEFLKHDNAERISAALTPKVAALPLIKLGEPFAVQGAQLDLATLRAADGVVGRGQAVVTGRAAFRASATVGDTFDLEGPAKARLEKGAILHLVQLPAGPEDDQPPQWWCGPVTITTVFGGTPQRPGCVRSTFDGYEWSYLLEEMQPLLTESINPPLSGIRIDGELQLIPVDLGTEVFPVEFRIARSDRQKIDLVLVALTSIRPVPLWRGTVPLSVNGTGSLTLWSKKLSISQNSDGAVSARLSDDGDGGSIE